MTPFPKSAPKLPSAVAREMPQNDGRPDRTSAIRPPERRSRPVLPGRSGYFVSVFFLPLAPITACAAARRAIGTRNGLQLT